jgi:arylsulfatase
VKDGRLHYVANYLGSSEQRIVGEQDVPVGEDLILSAVFERDGGDATCATGTLSLFHGDTKVGEGRIKTQLGAFAIAGEGVRAGRDGGSPVTDDYPGERPWRFTGGTVRTVAVDVSGEPYVDMEREAAAMLARE